MSDDVVCYAICGCYLGGWIALVVALLELSEYRSLRNAEITQCSYVRSERFNCSYTVTMKTVTTRYHGILTKHYYEVLSHYEMNVTEYMFDDSVVAIECSNYNDNTTDYQVYFKGDCIRFGSDEPQPKPKYDDVEWHTCYVANCDDNIWSFQTPKQHKQDYVKWFWIMGALFFGYCCAMGLGIYFAN
eukprot:45135_1